MPNESLDNRKITVHLADPYNPYEDTTLKEIEPEPPILESGNEPFNGAIQYENLVAGHQRNRTMSDYVRHQRPWVTVSAIVCLVLFIISLLRDFLH